MSQFTSFSDVQKGDAREVRINLKLQHTNKQGVYKNKQKDALTCWAQGCNLCLECTTGGACYLCGTDIWKCQCGFGNIRKQPQLMNLHFEEYFELIKQEYS